MTESTGLAGYEFDGYSGACNSERSVTLAYGDNVTCTLTNNDKLGKIVIIKNAKPQNGTFTFSTTGPATQGPGSSWPSGFHADWLHRWAGQYEDVHGGRRQLLGAGEHPAELDPDRDRRLQRSEHAVQLHGDRHGSSGVGNLNTRTVNISLKNGDTVTCVFENTGNGATRTQGFWATHPQLAAIAWNGGSGFNHTFPGVTTAVGDRSRHVHDRLLDLRRGPIAANLELMGGFWSDISKHGRPEAQRALAGQDAAPAAAVGGRAQRLGVRADAQLRFVRHLGGRVLRDQPERHQERAAAGRVVQLPGRQSDVHARHVRGQQVRTVYRQAYVLGRLELTNRTPSADRPWSTGSSYTEDDPPHALAAAAGHVRCGRASALPAGERGLDHLRAVPADPRSCR